VHNHAQILLNPSPYTAPARIERVREEYRRLLRDRVTTMTSFRAHTAIGLGLVYKGARVMAHLTPKKEHEVVIITESPHTISPRTRESA